jgi:hypothetical protein
VVTVTLPLNLEAEVNLLFLLSRFLSSTVMSLHKLSVRALITTFVLGKHLSWSIAKYIM